MSGYYAFAGRLKNYSYSYSISFTLHNEASRLAPFW
jgi:hypothetical protein